MRPPSPSLGRRAFILTEVSSQAGIEIGIVGSCCWFYCSCGAVAGVAAGKGLPWRRGGVKKRIKSRIQISGRHAAFSQTLGWHAGGSAAVALDRSSRSCSSSLGNWDWVRMSGSGLEGLAAAAKRRLGGSVSYAPHKGQGPQTAKKKFPASAIDPCHPRLLPGAVGTMFRAETARPTTHRPPPTHSPSHRLSTTHRLPPTHSLLYCSSTTHPPLPTHSPSHRKGW